MTNNLDLKRTVDFFSSGSTIPDEDVITLLDSNTLEVVNYVKTTKWINNVTIDSNNENDLIDNIIFRKRGNIYYGRENALNGERINVKWFGAKGNGSTSDASAIIAALDYQNKSECELFFPGGIYLVNTPVVLKNNGKSVKLSGEYKNTILKASVPMDFVLGFEDTGLRWGTSHHDIKNIQIDGGALANIGFKSHKANHYNLTNISIVQTLDDAFDIDAGWSSNLYNCIASSNLGNGFKIGSDGQVNAFNMYGSKSFLNDKIGVIIQGNMAVNMEGCTVEENKQMGLYINRCKNVNLNGCYIEYNAETGFLFENIGLLKTQVFINGTLDSNLDYAEYFKPCEAIKINAFFANKSLDLVSHIYTNAVDGLSINQCTESIPPTYTKENDVNVYYYTQEEIENRRKPLLVINNDYNYSKNLNVYLYNNNRFKKNIEVVGGSSVPSTDFTTIHDDLKPNVNLLDFSPLLNLGYGYQPVKTSQSIDNWDVFTGIGGSQNYIVFQVDSEKHPSSKDKWCHFSVMIKKHTTIDTNVNISAQGISGYDQPLLEDFTKKFINFKMPSSGTYNIMISASGEYLFYAPIITELGVGRNSLYEKKIMDSYISLTPPNSGYWEKGRKINNVSNSDVEYWYIAKTGDFSTSILPVIIERDY